MGCKKTHFSYGMQAFARSCEKILALLCKQQQTDDRQGSREGATRMNGQETEHDDETLLQETEEEVHFGFNRVYMIELLYKEAPLINEEALYEKVVAYAGKTDRPDEKELEESEGMAVWQSKPREAAAPGIRLFFHHNYRVEYEEGAMPAQTCILPTDGQPELASYETAIQQSWHWPEAGQTVSECRYSLLLNDFCAAGLPYMERLQLISSVLRALLESAPCDAVYFRASDKLVEPSAYLAALEEGQLLYGALNVRFYNVNPKEDGRSEMLVDTLGLAALGIPDVQCHYYELEPNEIASFVGDIGYYLFHNGDVISDGETVGPTELEKWLCEHQYALAAPQRVVLDLNPGLEYYAGRQHHGEKAGARG